MGNRPDLGGFNALLLNALLLGDSPRDGPCARTRRDAELGLQGALEIAIDLECPRPVIELLRGLSRSEGTTVIVVTHDAAVADQADRVLRLEDGRLLPATRATGEEVR